MSVIKKIKTTSSSRTGPQPEVVDMERMEVMKESDVESNISDRPVLCSRLSCRYDLRPLPRVNYNDFSRVSGFYWPQRRLRAVCRQCYRRNSQDIHLELQHRTHSLIDLVIKGNASPPTESPRKVLVNVFETLVNENTKRTYVRKVCQQLIKF